MNDSSPAPTSDPSSRSPEIPLDSWKEIAAYVKRDVTTVQRWEKREGMPVHRHVHDKRGSVYAYGSELDAWLQSRKLQLEEDEQEAKSDARVDVRGETGGDKKPRSYRGLILVGFVLAASLAVVYIGVRSRTKDAAAGKIKSIAVLPLKNMSGDPAQDYLADGMTEEVIGRLAMIRGVRVISRTSVMGFKDTRRPVPEIAKMLNVDALVEGSVIREGNRVRVHAQLIRADTDEHFWSETYDRDLGEALALESEVAQSIARRVEVTVTGDERARLVAARHVAPEVYESYLKGVSVRYNSKADVERSIAYFEDAISKDPTFAPAYVALAAAYDDLATVGKGGRPPEELRPKVIRAAQKALELDPDLAEAHALLGAVYQRRWQWADAEAEFKRALDLSPNDADANLGLADWLLCQGRTDEALARAQRSRELDPLGISGDSIGWILFHSRRYDEAIRELRSSVATDPDNATAHWFLGYALIASGQPQEAIGELEKARSLSDGSSAVIGVLIRAYAHAGNRAEALRLIDELKRRQQTGYVPAGAFVNAYLGVGDKEQAFVWLERCYQEKSNILIWIKVHPHFDPLRGDPRFVDLLHRVGLDQPVRD